MKDMNHTLYYVLAYYSESGELAWHTCGDVTTVYDDAKTCYDNLLKNTDYPVKLRSKEITWKTVEENTKIP